MDNLNQSLEKSDQASQNKASWPLIVFIILVIIAIGVAWQFTGDKSEPVVIDEPVIIVEKIPEPVEELPEPIIEIPEVVVEEEVIESVIEPLPSLDNSDDWLKLKLPEITWRKELLKLIIDEDMIRRFVVFTDNFAQGIIAYEHSPFILPNAKFTPAIESVSFQQSFQKPEQTDSDSPLPVKQNVWQWNENSSRRFSLYVDLLRSMDSENLVQWYSEIKPLIDEAYTELGYEDDFTRTLQDAITRVLDMELPKSSMALIQPSVMYKFADSELEALPDADKLLLRLGKDNLLVMKSVLLELHEKLAQQENGVH
ncbi:DUF3014 domain-containing protein [Candidatus Colwellia aromaticivorans]|uniref:DUF3014 domain-containing protein n=1 Tax=Candidatus Colwellia aromaticivorans TaxID=2267621 RepID=UPI000DF4466D|nr:DUF3014 domain-containing protein [Candidatus Colwellia aromaticivorans]